MLYQTEVTVVHLKGGREDFVVNSDTSRSLTAEELRDRVNKAIRKEFGLLQEVIIKGTVWVREADLVIPKGGLYSESWKRPGRSGIDHDVLARQ